MSKFATKCSLAELVEDPLVGLLMKSDGVDRRTVELLFERVARERARDLDAVESRSRDEESLRCASC